jgi:hypothetical protein
MALFKKRSEEDPIKALERQLTDMKLRQPDIAARLAAAEAGAAEVRRSVEQLAAAGAPDAELDTAEASMRAREDRTRTLVAALATLDDNVASLEADLARARHQRQADQVSAELGKMTDAIAKAAPERFRATNALINAIRSSTVSTSEATRVADYLASTENQIGEAISLLLAELRSGAESVRAGAIPFRLEGPAAPVETPPVIARTRVYTLGRPLKWSESGETITASEFASAQIPTALLSAAIRRDLVDLPTSQRAISYRRSRGESWGGPLPDTAGLIDLDVVAAEVAAEQDAAAVKEAAE